MDDHPNSVLAFWVDTTRLLPVACTDFLAIGGFFPNIGNTFSANVATVYAKLNGMELPIFLFFILAKSEKYCFQEIFQSSMKK